MYCISTCSGSLHNITAFHSTYNNGVSQNQTCRSCIGGGLGACSPRKIQNFRHSETVSRVILQALQQSPVHCCSWGNIVAAQLDLYYLHGTNCYLAHINNYNFLWHNSKIVQTPGLYKTYAPTERMHVFFIPKNEQQVFDFANVWRFNT